MRVSDALRFQNVTRALAELGSAHADAARQAATGERVGKPSDDPIAAAELTRMRHAASQIGAHREVVRVVSGDLSLAESALAAASELFVRAREIALQGGNGALGAAERAMLATEVKQLSEELVSRANQQGPAGYLFAGSKTDAPPFAANGAFSGDDTEHVVNLGAGATSAGANGAQAFTAAGGRDVFAVLEALRAALATDDAAGTLATLDELEASRRQIEAERGRTGLRLEKVWNADALLEQGATDVARAMEQTGGADPFEAFSRMTAVSQALERAVSVSKQLLALGSLWA